MRLIDADALLNNIEQSYLTKEEKRLISIKVRHAPTVDISKEVWNRSNELLNKRLSYLGRPQGEWIYSHDTFSKRICNKCNYSQIIVDGMAYNFCPNCGADMQKGDAE